MSVIPMHLGALPFGFLKGGQNSGLGRSFGGTIKPLGETSSARATSMVSRLGIGATDRVEHVQSLNDESLLMAYVDGDRAAFQILMQRYATELVQFLTRFLGSRAAADDVFQETFLQIHLSASTFDASRRFKPWLFTIAANKARDYHRKHGRKWGVSLNASATGDADGAQIVDLMEADVPSPDRPILDSERSHIVRKVVDGMPPHLREILLLSYFQRMSYNQIADSLEVPLGTVKSRLHAAVASFAKAWAAETERQTVEDDREP